MSDLYTIYGWTSAQWQKAQDYYNLCNRDAPLSIDMAGAIKACLNMRHCSVFVETDMTPLAAMRQVRHFWHMHRMDKPNETSLVTE